ncbi:alanine racemase [Halomonas sp. YLGW01]|uniref:alanine racemase n=1 Tax=Halomonas sp. YLGW01 TaxID=2773308 RepID=UPI00178249CC|nr:alanine racemase [Halomonas sp. YLGW01]
MSYDYTLLADISGRVGGSFYIFDSELFEHNYRAFRESLRHYYQNADVAYSFKANYMPELGRILNDLGGIGEVVSRLEYDIARRNLPPNRLIFNGPVKREEDVRYCIASGSRLNIDSFNEIKYLEDLSESFDHIEVGLRVSFSLEGRTSRFGFCCDNGDLEKAVKRLQAIGNVTVNGIHSHLSTREKSLALFASRSRKMIELANRISPSRPVKSINVGGGFFGQIPAAMREQFPPDLPSFDDYASTIGGIFHREYGDHGPRLIIEPGISLIGNTMVLVAEVLEIRERQDIKYALLDTSINVVNPTHSTARRCFSIVPRQALSEPGHDRYVLVGNTCMEHDVIDASYEGRLQRGDFVVFPNRGAYSNNYTPPFIMPSAAIVSPSGVIYKERDGVESILATYR